jgi:hypothetical protein
MININRNTGINNYQEKVKQNLIVNGKYNTFDNRLLSWELYKQRIFLEEVIDESTTFAKQLNWNNDNKNLFLTKTPEELLEVFILRSDVYTEMNYQNEFPDEIEGLNFDKYDKYSGIIYYKNKNNIISGTTRVIYDSKEKLPSEDKFSFDEQRKEYKKICELSRLLVKHEKKGLSLEFKYLMQGIHSFFINNNDINIMMCAIKKEHFKLYSKFGGTCIIKELENYGKLDLSALILSMDPSQSSNFFKKMFL